MTRSIRIGLLVMFVGLSIMPLLVIATSLIRQTYNRELSQRIAIQHEINARAAIQLTTFVEYADGELRRIIQTPDFKDAGRERQESVLTQSLFYNNAFDEFALFDLTGMQKVGVSRLGIVPVDQMRENAQTPEFLASLRNNQTSYGKIHFNAINGEPLLPMFVPTLDSRTGQPDGVLSAEVRLKQVLDRVVSTQFGERGTIAVVDSGGQIIAAADSQLLRKTSAVPIPASDGVGVGITGAEVLLAQDPLTQDAQTLYLIAELPLAEAQAEAQAGITTIGVYLLGTAIVASILGVLAVNNIVRPIQALAAATKAVSSGDFSQQITVTRRDEIGALQQNFNQMVSDLRKQHGELAEQHNRDLRASAELQQQLRQTVTQLSTPLLPVWEDVVVLPLIGHVDAIRGQELLDALGQGVSRRHAKIAILDITGIAAMDLQTAQMLINAMQTARLLGATPMLAGVSAEVAGIMVAQDLHFGMVATYRNLQTAVEASVRLLDEQTVRSTAAVR
ncbi:MAG: HAMP domain-containing protein [Oscillochloris sp.]|nr:HAMP domain-containing protein [Oscillochloris sp.]